MTNPGLAVALKAGTRSGSISLTDTEQQALLEIAADISRSDTVRGHVAGALLYSKAAPEVKSTARAWFVTLAETTPDILQGTKELLCDDKLLAASIASVRDGNATGVPTSVLKPLANAPQSAA